MVGVAKGLDYIHSHGVIHGDLKGVSGYEYPPRTSLIGALQPNILVDVSGNARITDFSLAQDTLGVISMPERWSMRWTAPEILAESGAPSTEADVFSFGMVMVEVGSDDTTAVRPPRVNCIFTSPRYKTFTGAVPFSDRNSSAVMIAIIRGKRPPRPAHSTLTGGLWELMNRCWDQNPHNRPRMLEVLLALNPLTHEYTRPSGALQVTADVPTLVSVTQQQVENTDPLNGEYRPFLHALLSHRDLKIYVNSLQRDDLQRFIELLDKVGTAVVHSHRRLYRLTRRSTTLRSQTISSERLCADCRIRAATVKYSHGLASFWRGHFRNEGNHLQSGVHLTHTRRNSTGKKSTSRP